MKKFFGNIQTLTIIVLVVLIILMRMCQGKPSSKNTTKEPEITISETIKYDTIEVEVPTYVPKWRDRWHPADTVFRDVDTAAILKDYFATYSYQDTIDHDSVMIYINDQVTENKIANRDIKYDILYPTKTITIVEKHYINEREFYIGPRLGGVISGQPGLSFVGVESVFRGKRNKTFSVAAGVNNEFGVEMQLGLHWKLNK